MRTKIFTVFGLCSLLSACGAQPGDNPSDPSNASGAAARGDAGVGDGGVGDGGDGGPGQPQYDPGLVLGRLGDGVATLTGHWVPGDTDGPRGIARFSNPVNVVLGLDGNLVVADYDNNLLRVVTPDGATTTLTRQANFVRPFGLVFGRDGALYVETDGNDRGELTFASGTIWRVDRRTGAATPLLRDLGRPRGLALYNDGRIVMVDNEHHMVELLNPTTLEVSQLAGMRDMAGYVDASSGEARFSHPYDVVVIGDRIIVADQMNNRLRAISPGGEVTTYAGSGAMGSADGARMTATFNQPQALAADRDGNIYVTELGGYYVRRVAPDGAVTTLAGTGQAGYLDGEPRYARFFGLEGLDVTADGAFLYVTDGNRGGGATHHRLRRLALVDIVQ